MTTPESGDLPKYPLNAIGKVYSPFEEKFAVPRQPGLTPSIVSELHLFPPFSVQEAFDGIETFSHIWLLFGFHQNLEQGWKPQVRPPRLGGNKKLGVFATRSSFRPNGIGMSVVELVDVKFNQDKTVVQVKGLDVVNDTPVFDIKPYIAYTDALPDAKSGFASTPPQTAEVIFSNKAKLSLSKLCEQPELIELQVCEALAQDPRPAYRKDKPEDKNNYGVGFAGLDFKWRVENHKIYVFAVTKIE